MAFEKTKARVRAEFAEPIEKIAMLAAIACGLAILALLVAMGARHNGS